LNDHVKKDEMRRACGTKKEKRNVYRILMGKLEGKRPLGRCVDNIEIDLRETGWDVMDWIDLA
jgi:hypothetical protein